LVVAGLAFAVWWMLQNRSAASAKDELIPNDTEAFLRLKVAKWWQTPSFREAFGGPEAVPAKLRRWLGIEPEQLEEVVLVGYRPTAPLVWAVLTLNQDTEETQLTANWTECQTSVYTRIRLISGFASNEKPLTLAMLSPREILLGDEASVQTALRLRRSRTGTGPMKTLVAGNADALAAVALTAASRDTLQGMLVIPGMGELAEVPSWRVEAEASDPLQVRMQAGLPHDPEQRAAVENALRRLHRLAAGAALLQPDPLVALVGNGDLSVEDRAITLESQVAAAPVFRSLAGWAARFGW
jgi:hypothetical protein